VTLLTRHLRFAAGWTAVAAAAAAVLAVAVGTAGSSATAPQVAAVSSKPSAADRALTPPAASDPTAPAPDAVDADVPDQDAPGALVAEAGPEGSASQTPLPAPGAEIPPVAPEEEPGLPESEAQPPMLDGPAPESSTAVNAVVDDFPSGIPIAGRSKVLTSDVAAEDQRVRVSLTAASSSSGADVLAEYDSAFAANGFVPAEAPAIGGSTARAYSRGAESVTVTVTPVAAGGSEYSVLALLVAQG
jgi:hypothetical protein